MAKHRKKTGLSPGSVVFTGNRKVEKIFLHYLQYNPEILVEKTLDNHDKIIFHQSEEHIVDWYDIRGLHDTRLIELIGKTFDIHPLVLEDVANIHQRPKYEEYEKGNFIVLRSLTFEKESNEVKTEQVSIYFMKGLIITFQEAETDLFSLVRERIRAGSGRIRNHGTDYLSYAIIDTLVDHYLIVLDEFEEVIEDLEDRLLTNPDNTIRSSIHHLKKELLVVRKSISPLREAISKFAKTDNPLVEERTTLFIRDLYDHTIQIMDMVETYRDTLNGLQDLYLSEISFKMNQVMQVLTVITTIFVPLSFLAGLYGMNFEYMPELKFKYGYFVLLAIMLIVVIGTLALFRRRNWI